MAHSAIGQRQKHFAALLIFIQKIETVSGTRLDRSPGDLRKLEILIAAVKLMEAICP